jgi:hypothetical protein
MAVTDNSPNKGRWAEDQYDRLPALAAELVSRQVAVSEAIGRELVVACRYPPTLRSIMTTPAMLSCSERMSDANLLAASPVICDVKSSCERSQQKWRFLTVDRGAKPQPS